MPDARRAVATVPDVKFEALIEERLAPLELGAVETQTVPLDVTTLPEAPGAGIPTVCVCPSGNVMPVEPSNVIVMLDNHPSLPRS